MKNNIKILMLAAGLAIGGCNDLNVDPQQELSTELAFSDKQATFGSLFGVYSLAQQFDVYGVLPQAIADFQSDNVTFIGSFPTLQEIRYYSTISDNSSISALWRQHYRVIMAANAVIDNAPNVNDPTMSDAEKAQVVAEAKFMRGLMYFQLVNLFAHPIQVGGEGGPGVPVVTESFTGEVLHPERATVGQVHAQIRTDLEQAIAALPEEHASSALTRGRATKGSAKALLSRFHLYRGEWQEAANYAKEVLDSPLYDLADDYAFWGENNAEYVFSIQNSEIDHGRTGAGGWASYYNPAEAGARGDAPFSPYLIAAFAEEEDDKRFTELTRVGENGEVYTTKFPDPINNSDNAPVIRTTEVVLNRAEALAQLSGVNQESIDLINELRSRAGLEEYSADDFASGAELVEAILVERRKELAFEGHRRMDLLRYEQALRPAADPQHASSVPGADKTILPIPQRERDNNPNLSQNKGY
jgi:hypothetical protein